jgi:GlpG protein
MAIELIVTDMQQDLRPFSRLLWQRGIVHGIHESAGKQVLTLDNEALSPTVNELYRRYQSGHIAPQQPLQTPVTTAATPAWQLRLMAAPLTLTLVLACVLGALVVYSGNDYWLSLLSFQSWFNLGGARFFQPLAETLQAGQWWRLWTPIVLHFGLLHLVFNALWLWEFGGRIEAVQGPWRLLGLVAVIALGSNCSQYYFAHDVLFGGMSGVVYGLVGYCWGWSLLRPEQDFGIPRVLIYAMMGLMVLALSGLFTLFGFGAIANAAHFSGFLTGLGLGLLLAAASTRERDGLSKTD